MIANGDLTKLDTVFEYSVEYVFNLLSYLKAKNEMMEENKTNG